MPHILPFALFEATKTSGIEPLTKAQQEFLNSYTEGTWIWNSETGLVDIKGNFDFSVKGRKDFCGVRFGSVSGGFDCSYNQLTSLVGAPKEVGENFSCRYNQLTSLEGAPKKVGRQFVCSDNQLTSLVGAPKKVGGFFCYNNQLTSLEGSPEKVGGDFYCHENQLTSLEGAPEKVGGDFFCYDNQLTSLVGAPKEVGGDFDCSENQLTSLVGAPKQVRGNFSCSSNQLTSLVGAPEKVGGFDCDSFYLENWSMKGFLDLLAGEEEIKDLNATRRLIFSLLDEMPPEELYKTIAKNENGNEILSRIRKEQPQLWDRIKGFSSRSSLSADMGDLFF